MGENVKHWSEQTESEWLRSAYQRERRRLLSSCHAHRKGLGLGRHSRKVRQLDLLRFRMMWAQVRETARAALSKALPAPPAPTKGD